jgi:LPXTG-motif cell wall-anchored protein
VTAVALAASAPSASAAPADVKYGGCTSSNPALAPAPPDYTTKVTLTPQGTDFKAGQAVKITWHYSTSTAPGPVGIPVANVATAKAKIVITGAVASTVTTADSAHFPPSPVAVGGTFQIPDMTATFTPAAAGTYTLTPGDNEQDVAQFGVVVNCKASGATAAATITVAAGSPGGGPTSSSTATSGGSTTSSTTAAPTSGTSTLSTLPHTGFDGRWLFGGVGLAAVLGGAGILATRRRGGSHG